MSLYTIENLQNNQNIQNLLSFLSHEAKNCQLHYVESCAKRNYGDIAA